MWEEKWLRVETGAGPKTRLGLISSVTYPSKELRSQHVQISRKRGHGNKKPLGRHDGCMHVAPVAEIWIFESETDHLHFLTVRLKTDHLHFFTVPENWPLSLSPAQPAGSRFRLSHITFQADSTELLWPTFSPCFWLSLLATSNVRLSRFCHSDSPFHSLPTRVHRRRWTQWFSFQSQTPSPHKTSNHWRVSHFWSLHSSCHPTTLHPCSNFCVVDFLCNWCDVDCLRTTL